MKIHIELGPFLGATDSPRAAVRGSRECRLGTRWFPDEIPAPSSSPRREWCAPSMQRDDAFHGSLHTKASPSLLYQSEERDGACVP